MADITDFDGYVTIRAGSEEVIAKIIALNSVVQTKAYYDTNFQEFEDIYKKTPDDAVKYLLSALNFEKTNNEVECKDLRIYGQGRNSIRTNLSWFLRYLLDEEVRIPEYKAMQGSIKNEDFDVIVDFYDVNVFDIDSEIDIAKIALYRRSGENSEEELEDNSVPLTPENLITYCHYEDALSPRYLAEHLTDEAFYPNIPEELKTEIIEVLTECDEPEEIAFNLSDIFDRIERTDLYNDLSKYK